LTVENIVLEHWEAFNITFPDTATIETTTVTLAIISIDHFDCSLPNE